MEALLSIETEPNGFSFYDDFCEAAFYACASPFYDVSAFYHKAYHTSGKLVEYLFSYSLNRICFSFKLFKGKLRL